MGVKIIHLAENVGQGGAPGLPCQCSAGLTMQLYFYKMGGLGNRGLQSTPLERNPFFFLKDPDLLKKAPIFWAPRVFKKTPHLEGP